MAAGGDGMLQWFSPQWRLKTVQVANWGCLDGIQAIEIACDSTDGDGNGVTMITGESGTGKTSLNDLHNELFRAPHMTREFNGSSANGQNKSRTIVKYLLGDKGATIGSSDNPRGNCMRDPRTNNWGGVCERYDSREGSSFYVCKLWYLAPDENLREYFVTSRAPVDLAWLAADGVSDVPWSRDGLSRVFGGSDRVRVHELLTDFTASVRKTLCIGADEDGYKKGMELARKVSNANTVENAQTTFRQYVMPRPTTYAARKKVLETWATQNDMISTLQSNREKMEKLGNIERLSAEKDACDYHCHMANMLALGNDDGAYAVHVRRRGHEILARMVEDLEAEEERRRRELREAEADVTRTEQEKRKAEELYNARGGDRLKALEAQVADAASALEKTTARAASLEKNCRALGLEVPTDEASFAASVDEMKRLSHDLPDEIERLEGEIDELRLERAIHEKARRVLVSELDAIGDGRTMLAGTPLDLARRALAEAAGIDEEDMPFAGELVDVADEANRPIVNDVLGTFATTVLVDSRELDRLRDAAEKAAISPRTRFQAVDLLSLEPFPEPRQGHLSGLVEYDESSPFASYVAARIADSMDYEIVDGPRQFDDRPDSALLVTRGGQTRDGRWKGAAGRGVDGTWSVIGFDNQAKRDALADDISAEDGEIANCAKRIVSAGRDRDRKREMVAAAEVAALMIQGTPDWVSYDSETAMRDFQRKRGDLERLRDENDLAVLSSKRDETRKAHENALQISGRARQRHDDSKQVLDTYAGLAKRYAMWGAKTKGVDVPDDLAAWADANGVGAVFNWEQRTVLFANGDDAAFRNQMENTRLKLVSEAKAAHRRAEVLVTNLSSKFADYVQGDKENSTGLPLTYVDSNSVQPFIERLREMQADRLDDLENVEMYRREAVEATAAAMGELGRAFGMDADDIEQKMAPVVRIIEQNDYDERGHRLKIDVVRLPRLGSPTREAKKLLDARVGKMKLLQFATADTRDDAYDWDAAYKKAEACTKELAKLKDSALDSRLDIEVRISEYDPADPGAARPDLTDLGDMSGGEKQKLSAIIIGAAFMCFVGQNADHRPTFAPIWFDEAFVKSDPAHTVQPIKLLEHMGFQVVLLGPTSKIQEIEPVADRLVFLQKDPATDASRQCVGTREQLKEMMAL